MSLNCCYTVREWVIMRWVEYAMLFDWFKMRSMPNISSNMAKNDEDEYTAVSKQTDKNTVSRHIYTVLTQ